MKIKKDNYTEALLSKLKKDYQEGSSLQDLKIKYNLNSKDTIRRKLNKSIKLRTHGEALKLAHKKYPKSFKHSEETKKQLSLKRLKWMKENPDKTAWRLNNKMSYSERIFKVEIEKRELHKKFIIEQEKSVFPYYIDFAFLEQKVAVEIDGSQHLEKERVLKDKQKDELLLKEGWRVFRVTAKQVKLNLKEVVNEVERFLGESLSYDASRIICKKTKRELDLEKFNEQRDRNNGFTDKEVKSQYNNRKIKNRPSKDILLTEVKELGYRGTGKKYGVSDNCIRKWIN